MTDEEREQMEIICSNLEPGSLAVLAMEYLSGTAGEEETP